VLALDGIHDLGGKPGYGRVIRETHEPTFHGRWEAEVFAIMRACGAARVYRNTDQFRHAIERVDPRAYLSQGYYGRWLGGLENLLVERGILAQSTIDERALELGGDARDLVAARPSPQPDPVDYDPVGFPMRRELNRPPVFAPGEKVMTRQQSVPGHTRLPAYARGKLGLVLACHDGWVFPDSNAHGKGEDPQYLYTLAFAAEDLWGENAEPGVEIHLDLFEPYLHRVQC